jgi:hypothetical protein
MTVARTALLVCACFIVGFISSNTAAAQSLSTASKGAEISVFGTYTAGTPDYGPFAKKGISAGGDFTIFPHFILKPSLEIRGNELYSADVTEKSVLFGPRAQIDIRGKFHPYGDFLIGGGEIIYHPDPAPGYTGDRSKVYSYGGGINIDVAHHLAAKFDFQQQSWNLGHNSIAVSGSGNFTLSPRLFMAGVTYTLPFRFLKRSTDYR